MRTSVILGVVLLSVLPARAQSTPNDTPRAIYFNTEGHVIRYNLTFPTSNKVIFESDGTQAGPRYRLSYWLNGRALDGKCEMAPPGSECKTYMSWTSKKDR
jgi:hypothetical protein